MINHSGTHRAMNLHQGGEGRDVEREKKSPIILYISDGNPIKVVFFSLIKEPISCQVRLVMMSARNLETGTFIIHVALHICKVGRRGY